jgi:hypothetical protein
MKKSSRWPLTISSVYILFILALVAFVIFSQYQSVDLVTKDYYAQELMYQNQIERIQRSKSLSDPVTWKYDSDDKFLTIRFPANLDPGLIHGNVLLFRPSDARMDRRIDIKLLTDGSQTVSTKHLSQGLWKLKIFWQLNQTDYYEEGTVVIR